MSKLLHGFMAFAILAAGFVPITARGDDSLAATYAAVKQSLAFIAYRRGKYLVTGSAFCVGNATRKDGTAISLFLTNAHVVGSTRNVGVSLASDQKKWHAGYVVRTNAEMDLAVVAITGTVPPLHLARARLAEGNAIAIAGYPGSNVVFALEGLGLSPAVHQGIVNSYEAGGRFMIFDAQVERGNSGGPVFDPGTGIVYAIVEAKVGSDQTNVGITIGTAFPFLRNAGVALGASRSAEVAQATPKPAVTAPPQVPIASPATIDAQLSGNVAEVLADPSDLGSQNFGVVVPFVVRDQRYRCSGGAGMTVRIRPAAAGDFLVVQLLSGALHQFASAIERPDAQGDVLFVGYVSRDGSVKGPREPTIVLPVHHPPAGTTIPIESNDGTAGVRTWLGSAVIQTGGHNYHVQVYQDAFKRGMTRVAYANGVGLVGILFENSRSQAVRACELESIALSRFTW
ncbi:MAG TPA: serine protease [Candidatus Baltobacteraceae bacterium]|nr:serine protease [Candidatus Baltobacteraceae bacterium]